MTDLGMCFPRTFRAALVTDVARRLDQGGADELWIIEDCFFTAGPSLVSAALTATERLKVGLGIVPAVVRTAAVTAMEFATLEALGPGRFLPGIGHGGQGGKGQMGVRPEAPLPALGGVTASGPRVVAGWGGGLEGGTVPLDPVRVDGPPVTQPPILLG